ncbi:MAG TPA: hypothetical protein VNM90_11110, partial [Haliangium sp.]|nr:hypothetical protein [Haliangium sp.]
VAKLRERLQALFEQDTTSSVATEAEAAASIGKAMAALAASDASSEEPPRAPSRSTSIVPVTQSMPSDRAESHADRMVEPSV